MLSRRKLLGGALAAPLAWLFGKRAVASATPPAVPHLHVLPFPVKYQTLGEPLPKSYDYTRPFQAYVPKPAEWAEFTDDKAKHEFAFCLACDMWAGRGPVPADHRDMWQRYDEIKDCSEELWELVHLHSSKLLWRLPMEEISFTANRHAALEQGGTCDFSYGQRVYALNSLQEIRMYAGGQLYFRACRLAPQRGENMLLFPQIPSHHRLMLEHLRHLTTRYPELQPLLDSWNVEEGINIWMPDTPHRFYP